MKVPHEVAGLVRKVGVVQCLGCNQIDRFALARYVVPAKKRSLETGFSGQCQKLVGMPTVRDGA